MAYIQVKMDETATNTSIHNVFFTENLSQKKEKEMKRKEKKKKN